MSTLETIREETPEDIVNENLEGNSLHSRIERNKQETFENIENYLQKHNNLPEVKEISASEEYYKKIIKDNLRLFPKNKASYQDLRAQYSSLIESIDGLRDAKMGVIRTRKISSHQDGSTDIIRDARAVTEPDTNSPEAFVMYYVNLVRGAELLIDSYVSVKNVSPKEIDELQTKIRRRSRELTALLISNDSAKINKEVVQGLTDELIDDLSTVKTLDNARIFENPIKALNEAKELISLDDTHGHISTISLCGERVVVESDIMGLGTTDEINKQFVKIGGSKPDKRSEVEWYDNMHQPLKTLIKKYASKLASGNYVIPTQLSNIVGARNLYSKSTLIKGKDNKLETIHQIVHCGAPVLLGKNQEREFSQLTMDQIADFVSADGNPEKTMFCSLNSSGGESADKEIVTKVTENSTKSKFRYNILPVNIFRFWPLSITKYENFNNILQDIGKVAEKSGYNNIASFLIKGENRPWYYLGFKTSEKSKAALKEVANIVKTNPELGATLANAIETKYLMEHNGECRNTEIIARMSNVIYSAFKGELKTLAENSNMQYSNIAEPIVFCKSGKDRTGFVTEYSTVIAVCNHLGIRSTQQKKILDVFKELAKSGHVQALAGRQGGTVGCHGIKGSTKYAIRGFLSPVRKFLFLKTASLNQLKRTGLIKTIKDRIFGSSQSKRAQLPGLLKRGNEILKTYEMKTTKQYMNNIGKKRFAHRTLKRNNQLSKPNHGRSR